MCSVADILISVACRHAASILEGKKSVELRRRAPSLPEGTRVWIYSKKPKGAVELAALLMSIVTDAPEKIWRRFGNLAGITRSEFDSYFGNAERASALLLTQVEPLARPVTLEQMRRCSTSFHPPQFYVRLPPASQTLDLLKSALTAQMGAPAHQET
jgi:predicted transcriptional regulator